jgi:hypothetical protein
VMGAKLDKVKKKTEQRADSREKIATILMY